MPAHRSFRRERLDDFDLGGVVVDFGPRKHAGSRFVDMTILSSDGKVRY